MRHSVYRLRSLAQGILAKYVDAANHTDGSSRVTLSPAVVDWWVNTPDTLRIRGGPRKPTGNGSNDDWYLCERGGTRFDEFFPGR